MGFAYYTGIALLITFILANLKSLPLIWHFRLFTFLFNLCSWKSPKDALKSQCPVLFAPIILHSRSSLLEIDWYMHKSNSSFFSDVDIARSHLFGALFLPLIRNPPASLFPDGKKKGGMLAVVVAGVSCTFKRELKPYEAYEIWTRVLSWDEKWVYFVSHFVRAGTIRKRKAFLLGSGKAEAKADRMPAEKAILATAISKNIFRIGRNTVPPEKVWRAAGAWPEGKDAEMEKRRVEGLEIAMGGDGLASHALFETMVNEGDGVEVLGEYSDIWAFA